MPGPRTEIVEAPELDSLQDFARSVAIGLTDRPRWLHARFLYDEEGSQLFEQICELPEYYQTRTEASILEARSDRIRELTGDVTLIELGSGSSVKTDHLLQAFTRAASEVLYVPVDVSDSILKHAADQITSRHPTVTVRGINGTYDSAIKIFGEFSPSMVLFLGSTIGNMSNTEQLHFWEEVRDSLHAGDYFLLGVDLEKEIATLEAAYNDSQGITARFTKNLFARMNRELGSDIDLDAVEHVARWNGDWHRIEISARFLKSQEIYIEPLGLTFEVKAGEQIMTEIARKFELEMLEPHLQSFGFRTVEVFTDPARWFAVVLLRRE